MRPNGLALINTAMIVDTGLALMIGAGFVAVLSTLPWFRRRSMATRLAPYLPRSAGAGITTRRDIGIHETLEPILTWSGNKLSSVLGVITDLETRLQRAGRPIDPYRFRLQQTLWALGALATAVMAWLAFDLPGLVSMFTIIGLPILALLWSEQSLSHAIESRQRQLVDELPVTIEQLGMLVCAGFSLTSAMSHIAVRGNGVVASDLQMVINDIRRGTPQSTAFESWAKLSGSPAVERLVAVLALNSEAADLGSLISSEARAIRAEAHRDLLEMIERRAQLVWIPVTVATLVPGLIFLAVPFYSAMSKITGG